MVVIPSDYFFESFKKIKDKNIIRQADVMQKNKLKAIKILTCLLVLTTSSLYGQFDFLRDPAPPSNPELEFRQQEQRRADSIRNENNTILRNQLRRHSQEIDRLKSAVLNIDTLNTPKQDVSRLIDNYRIDLGRIRNAFDGVSSDINMHGIIDDGLFVLRNHFDAQEAEIRKQFNELLQWINRPEEPKKNWLAILGIALGIVFVLAMVVMQVVMKIVADKNQKKTMKDGEWQALNLQHQQIPQNPEVEHLPLIEGLLSQYTGFIEKPPKKRHKNEALEKIKELKVLKLKASPKISILTK